MFLSNIASTRLRYRITTALSPQLAQESSHAQQNFAWLVVTRSVSFEVTPFGELLITTLCGEGV
jgi:hypothetical protein